MDKFIITGQKKLSGTVKINGAKNHALKVMAASLLTDQSFIIKKIPNIEDVLRMKELLRGVGCDIDETKNTSFTTKKVFNHVLDKKIVPRLRSSVLLLGPMLARNRKIILPHPGGCAIGKRPIDIFIDGFKSMGVKIKENFDHYSFGINTPLKGCDFIFNKISVTGTETMLMAACLAQGKTTLINAACEPEIAALAEFLNKCGAKIKGAGTPKLEIIGVEKLIGGTCEIIPDRIEALSFAILGVATNSKITITNCCTDHLAVPLNILQQIGAKMIITDNTITTLPHGPLLAKDIATHEYPGFPTDGQAPLTVLLTQAKGISFVAENIFENRFIYTDMLNKMGANIQILNQQKISIKGKTRLKGKNVESPDLRAGIAMIIAALIAEGQTEIGNIYQIDRGYEKIDQRLIKIGADIKRVK